MLDRNDTKPFLLGCLFSRAQLSDDKKLIFATSTYNKSKYVFDKDYDYGMSKSDYLKQLNYFCGYEWQMKKDCDKTISLPKGDFIFILENDIGLDSSRAIYLWIQQYLYRQKWILDSNFNENKKSFIAGFCESRGSIDTKLNYISQDYFFNPMDKFETRRINFLFDFCNLPINFANINFRDLQPQFVSGTNKRNTQFRVKLDWYLLNIGLVNKYKIRICENALSISNRFEKDKITYIDTGKNLNISTNSSFANQINYFSERIVGKQLSSAEVNKYRSELGWDLDTLQTNSKNIRLIDLVNIVKKLKPNKCAICGCEETFPEAATGMQHFEIHHMISLANDQSSLDKVDNLVKLCPTCHDLLKKGHTTEDMQKEAIIKILTNSDYDNVYQFCVTYFGMTDVKELANQIQLMLK